MGKLEYAGDMIKFLQEYYGDRPLVGAEIGVLNGDHALRLLQTLEIKTLYLIDPYKDYPEYHDHNSGSLEKALETAKCKLADYKEQIDWLRFQSDVARQFINPPLDFLYIDGNHSKLYVHNDLWNYLPYIADLGVIGGHDYYTRKDADNLCEVQEVVDDFSKHFDVPFFLDSSYEYDWPDWWFIKSCAWG